MNRQFSPFSGSSTLPLQSSTVSKTYGLLFLALAMTVVGAFAGMTFALPLIASGWIVLLFILEIALVWTAPMWIRSSPLNLFLFAAFPFLSGLTITPILLSVVAGYVNGGAILANALIATALLTASSAVLASMTPSLGGTVGRFLIPALIGLLFIGIFQLFIPSLRTGPAEMVISGAGIVIFSLFLAVDMQRLNQRGDLHSPFLMALSLYLDIYNLFLFVLRFMMAFGGRRN